MNYIGAVQSMGSSSIVSCFFLFHVVGKNCSWFTIGNDTSFVKSPLLFFSMRYCSSAALFLTSVSGMLASASVFKKSARCGDLIFEGVERTISLTKSAMFVPGKIWPWMLTSPFDFYDKRSLPCDRSRRKSFLAFICWLLGKTSTKFESISSLLTSFFSSSCFSTMLLFLVYISKSRYKWK